VKSQKNISKTRSFEEPSRADIKLGMTVAAQLVQRYGSKYWPVLERLKREYDALDDREELLASLLPGAKLFGNYKMRREGRSSEGEPKISLSLD